MWFLYPRESGDYIAVEHLLWADLGDRAADDRGGPVAADVQGHHRGSSTAPLRTCQIRQPAQCRTARLQYPW